MKYVLMNNWKLIPFDETLPKSQQPGILHYPSQCRVADTVDELIDNVVLLKAGERVPSHVFKNLEAAIKELGDKIYSFEIYGGTWTKLSLKEGGGFNYLVKLNAEKSWDVLDE